MPEEMIPPAALEPLTPTITRLEYAARLREELSYPRLDRLRQRLAEYLARVEQMTDEEFESSKTTSASVAIAARMSRRGAAPVAHEPRESVPCGECAGTGTVVGTEQACYFCSGTGIAAPVAQEPVRGALIALLNQVDFVLAVTGPMTEQQKEVWPELRRRADVARESIYASLATTTGEQK